MVEQGATRGAGRLVRRDGRRAGGDRIPGARVEAPVRVRMGTCDGGIHLGAPSACFAGVL